MQTQVEQNGIVTLTHEGEALIKDSPLWNEDLRPTTTLEHHWTGYNFASLWIGMAICIPTYTMAAGLISIGMNWWQAILTIVLGNLIVLIPILLSSHAGTKFGIPYPVFARLWFGTRGAHIPSLARALVGAGWFGINCWFGGAALDALLSSFTSWGSIPGHLGIAFAIFLSLNVLIAYFGPEAIRVMEAWAAPILVIMALALLGWAFTSAGGFGPMLSAPSKFATTSDFLKIFFPALTGAVAFWATLALNIPDFCRYAKSQQAQIWGQTLSLPTTMGAFSFIGVAVASATVVIFGEAIWDPTILLAKFPPFVIFLGTIGIVLATLTTNIAANIVAPARAIENILPRKITFGMGAIITGLIAVLMQPWYLLENFGNYLFVWLGTYGALLGPIEGIAIADYWLVRRRKLALVDLYQRNSRYDYGNGFNSKAIYALLLGIGASLLGKVIPGMAFLWENAWFVGLFVSGFLYTYWMKEHESVISDQYYDSITRYQSSSQAQDRTAAGIAE